MSSENLSMSHGHESLFLSQSIEKVKESMNQLFSALELCASSVSHYGSGVMATIKRLTSMDCVDKIVIAIQQLRHHIAEIARKISHKKVFRGAIKHGEVEFVSFADYLYHKMDSLTHAMHADSYLRRTFQWLLSEIKDMIQSVLHSMSLHHIEDHASFPRFVNTIAIHS